MPHFRIHIKLEQEDLKEYLIEDYRRDVDIVYCDYLRRTNEKNGAGRVIYFDLVMVAEQSLEHQDERKEVFNADNAFGKTLPAPTACSTGNWKKGKKPDRNSAGINLADRTKNKQN